VPTMLLGPQLGPGNRSGLLGEREGKQKDD